MSLKARLALGILGLVALAILLVGAGSSRAILTPFAAQVFDAFVDQALYVADRVEAGEDPRVLGERLGLEVRWMRHPPRGRRRELTVVERGGRTLAFPPGPRNRLIVQTDRGWIGIRRDLDLDRPQRRLGLVLLLVGLLAVGVAMALASSAIRPLTTAREGMERIASGDLRHRLDERGPEEIARVARAFNRMADRIDGLLRTERELMAGMSHELRTPLARLRLELELLRDAGASEKRVAAMEGDLEELDTLIAQLLQLSRLQLGERTLDVRPVDLRALAERVARDGVTVQGPGGVVQGDAVLLERVLVNLVDNALRYGAPPVTVRVAAPEVVVEDAGPGVADTSRLFDPFWRGEGSRARATGGLGLGLMLVRQVVELHGGTVTAENRPEGGLRIRVRLT